MREQNLLSEGTPDVGSALLAWNWASGILASGMPESDLLGISDLNDAFRGILAEQQIAQTLLATDNKTVFWVREARGSSAEVDSLFQHKGMLVKSGPTGRLRSLYSFID